MGASAKTDKIRFFSLATPQMRAFHMTWLAFMLCFFAWFGIAPLMVVVRKELQLTDAQVGWCVIASVASTIFARLLMGRLCDRIGPRKAYTGLLVFGSLPVMAIGLAQSFEAFLVFRLMIGFIGASFVITQYHTSVMFAPNCVGLANAMTAGIGNAGGGVANIAMPLVMAFFVGVLGLGEFWGWRLSMVVAGAVTFLVGIAYYYFTQDTPEGNFDELRATGKMAAGNSGKGSFLAACRDHRVWALFVLYGACFGIELTIHNVAAMYFVDNFEVGLKAAGLAAGAFGVLAIFARSFGGLLSDRVSLRVGLRGRVMLLGGVLLAEGLALMLFAKAGGLGPAVVLLGLFGVFVHMSCGATYAIVPFVNRKALGSVAGIVGAGGNAGAVAAGFLLKGSVSTSSALFTLGLIVACSSLLTVMVRFSPETEAAAREELESRIRAAGLEPVQANAG